MAAITPPAIEGVYGQRTYSCFVVSAMADSGVVYANFW